MLHSIFTLSRNLILFDLETTGTNPVTARAVSLGMRIYKPDGVVQDYRTLINPGIPIPPDAAAVHGITDEIIQRGCARCWQFANVHPNGEDCPEWKPVPMFKDIAANLHRGFCAEVDFAGYNIRYDLRVTVEEFGRCQLTFDWSQANLVDAQRIWQLLEPRTLSDCVEHFAGRKMEGAHDAMADVRGTEAALEGQFRHHRANILPRDVSELHELCWPRDPNAIDTEGKFRFMEGVPCFNFGKHKDKPMKNHIDYLAWMYGPKGSFSTEIKRICDEALAGKFPVQKS